MRLSRALLLTSVCALAAPAETWAQEVGEIVVTARKRDESILNVPVIETALPQAQLERVQVKDLKDISKMVPGLQLAQNTGALGTQVSLRGVGTSATNAGIDASVALNVDGLQITQSNAYASALFDVGMVEVLKGPQSLFYGKNSPGGVIAVRTADPTDRFEVIARFGHEFLAEQNRSELILSGPVSDSLRVRVAGLYDEQKGYFRNVAVAAPGLGGLTANRNTPANRNYLLRGTVLWSPAANFDARFKVTWSDDRTTGSPFQMVSCPDGVGAVPGLNIPFLSPAENCRRDRNLTTVDMDPSAFPGAPNGGVGFQQTEQKYGSLELNYRPIRSLTLTSTTGYYDMQFKSFTNGSSSGYAGPAFASRAEPLARRDLTQELRASSDFASPLNFTAGAYYQQGKLLNRVNLIGNSALRVAPSIGHYEEFVEINSTSAFGQLRWDATEKLEVAAGARWTSEWRKLTAKNLISGQAVLFPTAVPKIESDNVSPELTLTYRATDDVTAFGSLKKAFKSGSFNLTALREPNPDLSFGDEKAEGGEVGVKSRWLDRRLALNLAYYNYRYTGLQVGVNEPITGGVPVNRTINAGSALVYGVDFDATYRPAEIEGLGLRAAVAWNRAKFKTLNNVPCWGGQTVAEGCTQAPNSQTGRFSGQNLSGTPLVRAPEWQVNFGLDYERDIGHGLTLAFTSENQYSSKYKAALGLRDAFWQRAFFKHDVSLALRGPEDRWELAIIGKNITDKLTAATCVSSNQAAGSIFGQQITGGTTRGPAGVDEVSCFVDRGREVWLRLTIRPMN